MQQSEVLESLKGNVANEILDGKDIGLDGTTPLLEWGVSTQRRWCASLGLLGPDFLSSASII